MKTKEISDLGVISSLMTLGFSPQDRVMDGKRVIFIFEDSDQVNQTINDYYDNRLVLGAQELLKTQKNVKTTIYQMQRGQI